MYREEEDLAFFLDRREYEDEEIIAARLERDAIKRQLEDEGIVTTFTPKYEQLKLW